MRYLRLSLATAAVIGLLSIPAAASTFGINAHVPFDPIADEISEAGIGWVRVDFQWLLIEPERDVYRWKLYDDLIDRLEARGLKILGGIGSTPAWATSGPEFSGVPDDAAQWQELCYLLASRYRGRVDAWGIWNEPNSKRFWQGTRKEYIDILLLPGAEAIHTADPLALVCAPDLAHLSSLHWDDWLADVIRDAGHAIDVLTHHLYPSYGTAFEVTYDLDKKLRLPFSSPSIRRLLKDRGWWGRPFWLTETGIESNRYGEDGQAEYVEDLLIDWFGANRDGNWLDRIFFYHMYDGPQPAPSSFGIIESRPELERKDAFFAYQHFISEAEIDDAEVIDHDFPAFVGLDEVLEIQVILRNTGTTTWSASTGHFFDLETDADGWELAVTGLDDGVVVSPGESVALVVRLKSAPYLPGIEKYQVTLDGRMADGDGSRFGDSVRKSLIQTDLSPPVIQNQPQPVRVPDGRRTLFSIEVESDTPVHFRWRRNSVALEDGDGILGSHTKWLRLRNVDHRLQGYFDCVITNDAGPVVTLPAQLTLDAAPPRRPSNRRTPPAGTATPAR